MPGAFSPIPEVQVGAVALAFGITNNGTAITMAGTVSGVSTPVANFELDSIDLDYTWKEKSVTDTTGNEQNITKTNFKFETSVKFKPSGSTRAAAKVVANEVLTFETLTIANSDVPNVNGTWRVKPGTKLSLKMDDFAEVDMAIERWANASQNGALTGTPIAG